MRRGDLGGRGDRISFEENGGERGRGGFVLKVLYKNNSHLRGRE